MPTRTGKASPHETATTRNALSMRRALSGVSKNEAVNVCKSTMKPGCVVISSAHPISNQALYDAIHEY